MGNPYLKAFPDGLSHHYTIMPEWGEENKRHPLNWKLNDATLEVRVSGVFDFLPVERLRTLSSEWTLTDHQLTTKVRLEPDELQALEDVMDMVIGRVERAMERDS